MKFIHLGDVHLGATPDSAFTWSKDREKEIWDGFRDIIDICNKEDVNLLLIAGDFFHKQPLVRELKEANYIFNKLVDTKVVIVAGNHDYISPRSNYINFDWCRNVHMFMKEEIDSIYFEDINTEVYGLSYQAREIKEPILDHLSPQDNNRINILLAHGGTPTNIPFDKSKLDKSGFDYIALGHIHKPEVLGERIAYAGSMEPLDKNETGDRGFIKGEIRKEITTGQDDSQFSAFKKESDIEIKFIPHATRQYINIELQVDDAMTDGSLQDLAKRKLVDDSYRKGSKNIFIFTLTGFRDPEIIFDLDSLKTLGNVIDIKDDTVANYDFHHLYHENQDNIIGDFITYINGLEHNERIKTKALYYGIEALLEGKE